MPSNIGAFGENFPYSNIHDMNMDWVIKVTKENEEHVQQYGTRLDTVEETVENLQEYVDNIDEEIQEKIDTELPVAIQEAVENGGFNEILSESHARRIVFIGDSYGQGWTPDGTFTPWCELVKNFMGLSSEDWYNSSMGGAGFGQDSGQGLRYVPNLVQQAYENINNPETVTDVVVGLGYNDYLYSENTSRIQTGITTACTKIRTCFPNSRIHIFGIGFTTNKTTQFALSKVYVAYDETSADFQFSNLSKALANTNYFSSDGIHPLQTGQYAIAISVVRCLNNSSPQFFLDERGHDLINFKFLLNNAQPEFNGFMTAFLKNGNFHLSNSFFKVINLGSDTFSLNGNDNYKIAQLLNMAEFTGFYSPRPRDWVNGKFFVSTGSSTDYVTYDASFAVAQDQDNNDSNVYLWVKILGTTGTGFTNISNIYRWGVQGVNIELPFITEYLRK